ncbi:MAG: sigma-E processing peptidase SpoIIGA [Clostridia bacterium]|nr:sigma-E processing peptidase SpoIIGA [Clostridia bacterium]
MTSFYVLEFYNNEEMIVYVDIVFLENWILDFIILLATRIICNSKRKIFRLVLGGLLGSLYTTLSLVFGFQNMVLTFLVSAVMVWISFGYKSSKNFVKHLGGLYLVAITFGGASLLFANLQKLAKILICGGIAGFILIVFVLKLLKQKFEKICEVEIEYHGKKTKIKALVDSREFVERENIEFASCDCGGKMCCGFFGRHR